MPAYINPPRPPRRRLETLNDLKNAPPPKLGPRRSRTPPSAPAKKTYDCCDSPDIVKIDGKDVCQECGFVHTGFEGTIENDQPTFGETAGGRTILQGGIIGDNQRHAGTMGMRGIDEGMGSRAISERNGRTEIMKLTTALALADSIAEQAFSIYKLCLNDNFIQGRRIRNVAAVAIYYICRKTAGNTVLLLDLSDKIQVSVWALGDTYKALLKILMVDDPGLHNTLSTVEIEPLLLKYCKKLEFGEDAHQVARDAARLLKRMNRDWMVQGRQPAGICGACIILAARMNNYRRTVREVVYVVKVADQTINSRLHEFKRTQSSQLTVDQFRRFGTQLKVKAEPPAVYKRREREERRKRKRGEVETGSDEEAEAASGNAPTKRTTARKKQRTNNGDTHVATSSEETTNDASTGFRQTKRKRVLDQEDSTEQLQAQAGPSGATRKIRKATHGIVEVVEGVPTNIMEDATGEASGSDPTEAQLVADVADELDEDSTYQCEEDLVADNLDELGRAVPLPKRRGRPPKKRDPIVVAEEDLEIEQEIEREINEHIKDWEKIFAEFAKNEDHPVLKQSLTRGQLLALELEPRAGVSIEEDIGEDEFDNDPEIADCLRTPAEVVEQEKYWVSQNEDWLREQQKKMLEKELLEAQGGGKKPKLTRRKKGRMGDGSVLDGAPVKDAADAAMRMMNKRAPKNAFSNFIDYERLQELFRGPSATPSVNDENAEGDGAVSVSGSGADSAPAVQTPPITQQQQQPPHTATEEPAGRQVEEEYYEDEDEDDDEEGLGFGNEDYDENW